MRTRQGFGGVVNHGQVEFSELQSSSSATFALLAGGPTSGELPQSDGRLSGAGAVGDGSPVTLAAVPSLPVLSCQQFPLLLGSVVIPPWSHQKSTPFGWTLPSGACPILLP